MAYKPLPIGIDDFEKLRTRGCYYVDKSLLIKELLDKGAEVNLFTRPRRFGKTLNLSMLKYFFEKPLDEKPRKHLFDGLEIMKAGEAYTGQQEQYPVITLTLKSAKQLTYEFAYAKLREVIAREFYRHDVILDKIKNESRRKRFIALRDGEAGQDEYLTGVAFLSDCLYEAYQKKTIILIDEYDVPLENAYYAGFYNEMIAFIRSLFESALKTNPYLEFAVITGCLRISKESIFTGLNNLKVISILSEEYAEHFGFTELEVKEMLRFYGREAQMDTMKEWYDGYRFGNTEVYNPWSAINYTEKLYASETAFPIAEWSNTSSNSIVKDMIYHASDEVREEIEALMLGGTIEKKVHEDITYDDIYATEDNLWNFLFFTGYLRMNSMRMENVDRYITMSIPNNELMYIYVNTVDNWFRDRIKMQDLSGMYQKMLEGDAEAFQAELEEQLQSTISYMDNTESFYHGFLLGLFAQLKGYRRKSNKVNSAEGRREGALGHRESGFGRYDICIYSLNVRKPVILMELKLAGEYRLLGAACDKALEQIEKKEYDRELIRDGYTEVICYGIGFYKKQVQVKMERKSL